MKLKGPTLDMCCPLVADSVSSDSHKPFISWTFECEIFYPFRFLLLIREADWINNKNYKNEWNKEYCIIIMSMLVFFTWMGHWDTRKKASPPPPSDRWPSLSLTVYETTAVSRQPVPWLHHRHIDQEGETREGELSDAAVPPHQGRPMWKWRVFYVLVSRFLLLRHPSEANAWFSLSSCAGKQTNKHITSFGFKHLCLKPRSMVCSWRLSCTSLSHVNVTFIKLLRPLEQKRKKYLFINLFI